ncbi:MAG: glycosyltransferase [Pseudomonadota bacterium]
MKILIVLPSYDSGGAENYSLRLIQYLNHLGFEWHVTSRAGEKDNIRDAFGKAGAVTHCISAGVASPASAIKFYKFLVKERFDVIMTFIGVFGGISLALGWLAGVNKRIGWHRRSSPAYSPTFHKRAYAFLSLKLLGLFSTKILSNSEVALDRFHPNAWRESDRFLVIPNGVDGERFKPLPSERKRVKIELGIGEHDYVIGHVGRFDPAKDHRTLFSIVQRVKDCKKKVRLLVVGSGTDSQEFKNMIDEYGLVDACCCLGMRGDVERLYLAMDLFVFTSVTEGQPNALIEAMLCEVPVIATSIPPIKDTIPDGLHGYLFSPGDIDKGVDLVNIFLEEKPYSVHDVRKWAVRHYDVEKNFKKVIECLVE